MKHPNTLIIICGPTAVGKTLFAIELAQQLQTEIISADSRQCYKELSIGVAKPYAEELQAVYHYFINSHSVYDEVNAAIFTTYALDAAQQIFSRHKVAVMVGGTGLYIKAFCHGLDDIPTVDESIRQHIINNYEQQGITYLQDELKQKDPIFWQQAEQQNPQRLMRALEVLVATGQSITTFRKGMREERDFNIVKIGLQLPREQLYQQVNNRVDAMINNGLVEEVKGLHAYQHLSALQTVGYTEIFEHLQQTTTLQQAIDKIKANTRHYAKRQLTWFKKDEDIHWLDAGHSSNLQYALSVLPK